MSNGRGITGAIDATFGVIKLGALALVVFLLSGGYAPRIRAGISASPWALPLHVATAICALGAFAALWKRKYRVARFCAAAQVTLILWGSALAQFPTSYSPASPIQSAAAPPETLRLLLMALGAVAVILFPSFYYLFRVFKG